MHNIELLITRVGLSIICLYPADDLRESVSCPVELVMSFFHHREYLALKSPAIIEHSGNLLFILLIVNKILYRNLKNRHESDLGNDKHKLENVFYVMNEFLSLNNYLKYKCRLV